MRAPVALFPVGMSVRGRRFVRPPLPGSAWAVLLGALLSLSASSLTAAPLNDALDQPDLVFSVLGSSSVEWMIDTADTHDGVDAVRSPLVRVPSPGSQAYFGIETDIDGPADVRFWWKRSGGGAGRIFVNYTWSASMPEAGVGWAESVVSLGLGRHHVAWRIDVAPGAAGDGTLWLDAVAVVRPPLAITVGPLAEGEVGQPFQMSITTTAPATTYGAAPLPDGLRLDPETGVITGVPQAAGDTRVLLSASTGGFTASSEVRLRILPPAIPLADALDGDGIAWQVSPATVWRGRQVDASTDVASPDRARQIYFPDVPDYASYRLETTLTGPDVITFSWKPWSASLTGDALRLWLDGRPVAPRDIPGLARSAWRDERLEIPPGDHTLRWEHSGADWNDTGLDRVTRASGRLLCLTGPRRFWLAAGSPVHQPVSVNQQKITFTADALPPGLVLEPLTGVLRGTPTEAGDFVCNLTATSDGDSASMALVLSVTPVSLGTALAQPDRTWTQLGSGWYPLAPNGIEISPTGEGSPEFGSTEAIRLETEVVGPDTVSFEWDASYSFILGGLYASWEFSIDGTPIRSLHSDTGEGGVKPGTIGWQPQSVEIPPGRHRLSWQFTGNRASTCCFGSGFGRLQSVRFTSDHTTFAVWAASAGLAPAVADPEHDPDGDSRTNWTEYAFLSHPGVPDAPAEPAVSRRGPMMELDFPIRPGAPADLVYSVTTTAQLATGSWRPPPASDVLVLPDRILVRSPIPESPNSAALFRLMASPRP